MRDLDAEAMKKAAFAVFAKANEDNLKPETIKSLWPSQHYPHWDGLAEAAVRTYLIAAIGAGGQAVADGAEEQELDRLRLQAFKTNSNDDKAAYYLAVSKWFQDRHYRALSQPHPADERVVEALREARRGLNMVHDGLMDPTRPRQSVGEVAAYWLEQTDAALAALTTEGRKNG